MKKMTALLLVLLPMQALSFSITEMSKSLESGKKVPQETLDGIKKDHCQDLKTRKLLGTEIFQWNKENFDKLRVGTNVTYSIRELDEKSGRLEQIDAELWTLIKKEADKAEFSVSNLQGQNSLRTMEKPVLNHATELDPKKPLSCLFFNALYYKIARQSATFANKKVNAIRYERQGFEENGYFILSQDIPLSQIESSKVIPGTSGSKRTLIKKLESYQW